MATYKPGTVAVLTWSLNLDGPFPVVRGEGRWHMLDHLHPADDKFLSDEWLAGLSDVTIRPLVTLDPEDARCVVTYLRLAAQYAMNKQAQDNAHRIADQIESQTRPPRPEEPTGLGAVVEDSEGHKWVRTYLRYGTGWVSGDEEAGWSTYAQIDVVRVLSEGVRP